MESGKRVPALVISGSVGVGKSSVAAEVGQILARRAIAHAVTGLDALTATCPRPPDDPFGSRLAIANLRDVWRNAAAAGARNVVIARVTESAEEVEAIRGAVSARPLVVCRLRADLATLQERIRQRESGSGLAWHLQRAAELAPLLDRRAPADHVVETEGRGSREIAAEIAERVHWAA